MHHSCIIIPVRHYNDHTTKMLGLGIVFKALLLIINAMAVIHEERFLRKGKAANQTATWQKKNAPLAAECYGTDAPYTRDVVGWSEQEAALDGGVKLQIVNLLKAFRVLRCE